MNARSMCVAAAKWRRITVDERRTLLHALFLVPALHIVVRVIGYDRTQRWVAATQPVAAQSAFPATTRVRLCAVSVNRVKCFSPLRGNCLSQSLALARLMRRRGLEPALRLGVRVMDSKFDAHAWVEFDGRVLNDTQDVHARFAPLVTKTGS